MKLDKYIEGLLYRYECVVIPNFGAFITSRGNNNGRAIKDTLV